MILLSYFRHIMRLNLKLLIFRNIGVLWYKFCTAFTSDSVNNETLYFNNFMGTHLTSFIGDTDF
jgi:hypothetical protein